MAAKIFSFLNHDQINILDVMPDAIVISNEVGEIIYANKQVEKNIWLLS